MLGHNYWSVYSDVSPFLDRRNNYSIINILPTNEEHILLLMVEMIQRQIVYKESYTFCESLGMLKLQGFLSAMRTTMKTYTLFIIAQCY